MRTVVAAQGGVGVGEQLIVEQGFHDAELHTMVGNKRALGLYESAGWQLTDRLIHSAHDGVEYDEPVLVKQLDVTTAR